MAEFDKFGTSWSGAVIFHPLLLDSRGEERTDGPNNGPYLIVLGAGEAEANLTKYVWQWLYDKDKILTNKSALPREWEVSSFEGNSKLTRWIFIILIQCTYRV